MNTSHVGVTLTPAEQSLLVHIVQVRELYACHLTAFTARALVRREYAERLCARDTDAERQQLVLASLLTKLEQRT